MFVNCALNTHSSRVAVRGGQCALIPPAFDYDEAAERGGAAATQIELVIRARADFEKSVLKASEEQGEEAGPITQQADETDKAAPMSGSPATRRIVAFT